MKRKKRVGLRAAARHARLAPLRRAAMKVSRIGLQALAAGAAFAAAMTVDFDPRLPFSNTAPASAHVRLTSLNWTLDLDGDGKADVANPTHGVIRGRDAYGSGAFDASRDGGRRHHHGSDYVAAPGDVVRAPISGEVVKLGTVYGPHSGYRFVELRNPDTRLIARVLYVDSRVRIGDAVQAGDLIGFAEDLTKRYRGITNHVHVELSSPQAPHIDPALVIPSPGAVIAAARSDDGA